MTEGPRSKSRVRLVCFDAMFTTLRPARGTRKSMIAEIYRQIGGIDPSVSDERLGELILEQREKQRSFVNDESYWYTVNRGVFLALAGERSGRKSAKVCALQVHARITSDPGLYEPDAEVVALIRALRRDGIRVVLASNQERASLAGLLDHHSLHQYFEAEYTSEELGTRKPFPEFWNRIMAIERCRPRGVVHVGNSLNSDIGAAQLGIRTLIWDPRGHIKATLERGREERFYHPDMDQEAFTTLLHSGLVSPFRRAKQGHRLIQAWGGVT